MTIPNPYIEYTTNGTQDEFTFPFELLQASDLTAWFTPQGQTFNEVSDIVTNYSVTINPTPQIGGKITFDSPPAADGTLVIRRIMVVEIDTSFSSVQAITGTQLDDVFERVSLLLQQVDFDANGLALHYPANAPGIDQNSSEVAVLEEGQIWKKVSDKVIGVTLSENPDWSTLRSELASEAQGGDGASIVGYYDSVFTPNSTTVDAMLTQLAQKVEELEQSKLSTGFLGFWAKVPATGWLEVDDTDLGDTGSGANHTGSDFEDLYTFIWENYSQDYCRTLDVSGNVVARGASASADWSANRRIELPKLAGGPIAPLPVADSKLTMDFTFSGEEITPTQSTGNPTERFVSGMAVKFATTGSLPSPLNTLDTFYITVISDTVLKVSDSMSNYSQGTFLTLSGGTPSYSIVLPNQSTLQNGAYRGCDEYVQAATQVGEHIHEFSGSFGTTQGGGGATTFVDPGTGPTATEKNSVTKPLTTIQKTGYMHAAFKL